MSNDKQAQDRRRQAAQRMEGAAAIAAVNPTPWMPRLSTTPRRAGPPPLNQLLKVATKIPNQSPYEREMARLRDARNINGYNWSMPRENTRGL